LFDVCCDYLGISLNNLAASELARKRYDSAEILYQKSIENAEDILKEDQRDGDKAEHFRNYCILSDRRTGLAVVYFESGRKETAMEVLEPAMQKDLNKSYLIGYTVKRGIIGELLYFSTICSLIYFATTLFIFI